MSDLALSLIVGLLTCIALNTMPQEPYRSAKRDDWGSRSPEWMEEQRRRVLDEIAATDKGEQLS